MEKIPEVELTSIKAISENGQIVGLSERSTTNIHITDAITSKPGLKIRPLLKEEDVIRLAERLYGISTSKISQLVSYADQNYLIHVDT